MVNYQNGKIYKIEDVGGNMCYIGSTTKDFLSQRMAEHRRTYKSYKSGHVNNYSVFNIFDVYDVSNCRIILLELYPCETKDELTRREAHHIKTTECVNKQVPHRSQKENHSEYYIEHRDEILDRVKQYTVENKQKIDDYQKQYKQEHKEKLYARQKEVIQCECGSTYTRSHKLEHNKSKKHLNGLANQVLTI